MDILKTLTSNTKAETVETPDEDPRDEAEDNEDEEAEERTIRITEAQTRRHTVHLGVAEFIDGETKRYMFDALKHKNDAIVLYDFTDFGRRDRGKEAFVTIAPNNLKTFETIRREEVNIKVGERTKDMEGFDPDDAEEYAENMREKYNVISVEVLDL